MAGYTPGQIRKALVALATFLATVIAVVLEHAIGVYGDGNVSAGEWLALAITAANALATYAVPNDPISPLERL